MKIANKSQYLKLAAAGTLGNTLRTWPSLDDLIERGYPDDCRMTIRNRAKGSPYFVPTLFAKNVKNIVEKLVSKGADPATMYFQEVPHLAGCRAPKCEGCGRIMNAEVMRDASYIYMTYGTNPSLSLRTDIFEHGIITTGIQAVERIKTLDLECYDTLQDIWERYPDSIIEFTIFGSRVGVLNQRTVTWEVRNF